MIKASGCSLTLIGLVIVICCLQERDSVFIDDYDQFGACECAIPILQTIETDVNVIRRQLGSCRNQPT